MSVIPPDISREILLKLPAESLFRFRSVCKAWRLVIDDPSFIKSHTNNQLSSNTLLIRNSTGAPLYRLNLDSLNFSGGDDRQTIDATLVKQLILRGVPRLGHLPKASCNGLILLSSGDVTKIWVIRNPLTEDWHELPQADAGLTLMGTGLGYDCAAHDYKVLRIDNSSRDGICVNRTLVYSMNLGSWKTVKNCPSDLKWSSEGVFLNGVLHWTSWDMIIAFDLGTEVYRQLPMPPLRSKHEPCKVHLDALGGCLILSYYYYMIRRFEGWVMNDYGVETSWMKLFSIRDCDIVGSLSRLRPVAYLKGKSQVLLQHDRGLFWLDVADNSVKKVTVHGHPRFSSSQICPGSLVRLDNGGGVAADRTTGLKRKRKMKSKKVAARLKFCMRDVNDWYCSDVSCRSSDSSSSDSSCSDSSFSSEVED